MAWTTRLLTRLGLVSGTAEADREAEYHSSSQGRLAARRSWLWWTMASLLLIAVPIWLNAHTDAAGNASPNKRDMAGAAAFGLAALLSAFAGIWVRINSHHAWAARALEDSHRDIVAASRKVETQPTAENLGSYNRLWLLRYHDVTLAQATSAYRFAQLSAVAGFAVLIAGGISAIIVGDTGAKVTSATLTGIASVLAAYISRTFKATYERTLVQLEHFFEQPLIDSYIITAERLCANDPPDTRATFLHGLLGDAVKGALAWGQVRATAASDVSRPRAARAIRAEARTRPASQKGAAEATVNEAEESPTVAGSPS
jgi:hypothetical protein